jgi:hypothetical protein
LSESLGTLDPYEAKVLRDYRTGASIEFVAEVAPGVIPIAAAGVVKSVSNTAAKLKIQAAKRAMDRGSVAKTFQSKFWNRHETHTFLGQTNKVYKRDDLIDLGRVGKDGRTNFQRMKVGDAPLVFDNKPINLHHMTQTQSGPIAEVTATMHTKHHRVLHIWANQSKGGVTRAEALPEIDRAAFDKWRSEYWKARAAELTGVK